MNCIKYLFCYTPPLFSVVPISVSNIEEYKDVHIEDAIILYSADSNRKGTEICRRECHFGCGKNAISPFALLPVCGPAKRIGK